MKKLFAIVLAMILCLSVLPVVTFAANDITVHVYVPADWTTPHIYAWGTEGDGDPSWPGAALTQVDGQWYEGTISADYVNLIINNNTDDSQKTADLSFDGGYDELWVVAQGGGGVIYYDEASVQLPDPSAPPSPDPDGLFKTPDSLYIVGANIPGMGYWAVDDANAKMEVVSENVYAIEIHCAANTSMEFKFAGNGVWDDSCNLHSGTPVIGGTCDMSNGGGMDNQMRLTVPEATILKFTVDLNPLANGTGAATLTIEKVEGEVVVPETPSVEWGDTVKVYARIPAEWGENPCCWAWKDGPTNAFTTWPGDAMKKEGEWYVIEVPNWVSYIIINDGNGDTTTKTEDMTIEAGKNVWIDVFGFDGNVITYEDPGERPDGPASSGTQTETIPAPTQPTAAKTEDKSAIRTRVILIIVLVLVWIVVIAEIISIVGRKKK